MEDGYYGYFEELAIADDEGKAAENAHVANVRATNIAETDSVVTQPIARAPR